MANSTIRIRAVSWDVLLLHPGSSAHSDEGQPQLRPLGMADEVRRAVTRALPGIEWDEPVLGSYRGLSLAVDVVLPSRGVVDSMALHLSGPGDPLPVVLRLCRQNGWVAFDSVAGDFLDLQNPNPDRLAGGARVHGEIQAVVQIHARAARLFSPSAGSTPPVPPNRRRLLWTGLFLTSTLLLWLIVVLATGQLPGL